MMNHLQNQQRMTAQLAGQGGGTTRLGALANYDPNTMTATVMLLPEQVLTGYLPIKALQVGSGWGIVAAPNAGDAVVVEFQEGDSSAGVITGFLFNDLSRPPAAPAGEVWIVRKDGGFIKLTNDGKISINGHAEIDMTAPTLNITVSGNATVSVGGTASYTAALHHFSGPVAMDGALTVAGGAALNGGFSASAPAGGGLAGTINGDVHGTGTARFDTDVIAAGKSGATHAHVENGAGHNTNPPN